MNNYYKIFRRQRADQNGPTNEFINLCTAQAMLADCLAAPICGTGYAHRYFDEEPHRIM